MADWSSLPSELVRRIADCLLSTNDLDCYMDFRAVCQPWRSATDDPKDSSELRFRPHWWIVIDEVFESESRLLVNTISGRVVRKDMPMLLRRFYVVSTTHGGFFVLADKEPPHAARILNPFTGHMILFIASVPTDIDISAAALLGGPFPNLVLLCDGFHERYTAAADSEVFTADSDEYCYRLTRLLVAGGVCPNGQERFATPTPAALPKKIFDVIKLLDISPVNWVGDYVGQGHGNSCFLVKSPSGLLVVVMLQHQFKVFNVTTSGEDHPEPVKSIGSHAIFVGYRRCVCVTADNFPSVVANCIYYVKPGNSSQKIYKYDLDDEKEDLVSEAIDSLNPAAWSSFANCPFTILQLLSSSSRSSFANCPFTIVQLLSSYTINARVSQLPKEKWEFPDWFFSMDEAILDGSFDISDKLSFFREH